MKALQILTLVTMLCFWGGDYWVKFTDLYEEKKRIHYESEEEEKQIQDELELLGNLLETASSIPDSTANKETTEIIYPTRKLKYWKPQLRFIESQEEPPL